jgi:hypothetical protein
MGEYDDYSESDSESDDMATIVLGRSVPASLTLCARVLDLPRTFDILKDILIEYGYMDHANVHDFTLALAPSISVIFKYQVKDGIPSRLYSDEQE